MKFFRNIILFIAMASSLLSGCSKPSVQTDANLKIKTLSNGFTVAVFKNSEPPDRCSMRLLVKSGSLFERESERGLAHFIEHMAFNGTEHFPSGVMTEYFQRLGMAFGSDTNAHTSFTETVYKLELPETGEKILKESLLLLRDYADKMTFEQSFIDSERSVVLAEMSARDDANYRKAVREIGLIFKGTTFADRMPIGTAEVVKTANRDAFFEFYRANYRPDNMVLVVVGDVEPEKIFELAAGFESFKKPAAAPRALEMGELSGKNGGFGGDKLDISLDAVGVPNLTCSTASLSVAMPVGKNGLDSVEARAESDRLNLLGYVLNARFQRIADAPDAEIVSGGASFFDYCAKVLVFSASCDAPLGKWRGAAQELFRQLLSVDSITDAEVENAKKKIIDILQTAINGKNTRKNSALASEITSAFSDGITYISPELDMELTKRAFQNFGAAEMKTLFNDVLSRGKISLLVSDSDVPEKAELEKSVGAAYSAAAKSKYGAEKFGVSDLVFSEFGAAGKIVSERKIDKLGIAQIKFQNGVALNVKSDTFTKDEVLLNVCIGGGVAQIPADKPEFFASAPAIILGGTKFQTAAQINAAANLLKMGVSAKISGGSLLISGSSNTRDAEKMLRYAATLVADPAFRDDATANLRNTAEAFYRNYETEPSMRLKFMSSFIYGDTFAKIPGKFEDFAKHSMADFAAWLRPILGKSYMEISIVGDIDERLAVRIVSETFGAMPEREKTPFAVPRVKFEGGKDITQTYLATDEPRSLACVVWNASFGDDMHKMRTATILGAVLDDVLRKDIREGEGNVYSPFAFYTNAAWLGFDGAVATATFVEPAFNAELVKKLSASGLKTAAGISADEFERAKIPIIKSLKTAERNNKYWLFSVMSKSQAYPLLIEMALNREEFYKSVTLEQVRAMAAEIFAQKPSILRVMPSKTAARK